MDGDPNPKDPNRFPQTYGNLINLWTSAVRDYHSLLSDYLMANSIFVAAIGYILARQPPTILFTCLGMILCVFGIFMVVQMAIVLGRFSAQIALWEWQLRGIERHWKEAPQGADAAIHRYGHGSCRSKKRHYRSRPGSRTSSSHQPSCSILPPAGLGRRSTTTLRESGFGGSSRPFGASRKNFPSTRLVWRGSLRSWHSGRAEINSAQIDAAIKLAQHYALEALGTSSSVFGRPEILRAEQLLDWLMNRDGELISAPDVYQFGPTAIRDAKAAHEAIHILEEHGCLEPVSGGAVLNGIRRGEVWRIIRGAP